MVIIAKDFNEDLQEYLDRIYGKKNRYVETVPPSKNKGVKPSKKQEVVPDVSEDEVYVEYDSSPRKGFLGWFTSLFNRSEADLRDDVPPEVVEEVLEAEAELKEIDEDINELEEERESVLRKFLNLLNFSRRKSVVDEELEAVVEQPVLPDDVVDVLKRLHKWLERLPNREMRDFKTSEDFVAYKDLLEKYGLIKK